MKEWDELFLQGELNDTQVAFFLPKQPEELYDIVDDPDNVRNLAGDPAYKSVLLRMRKANIDWLNEINDKGFIPEPEMIRLAGDTTIFEYFRNNGNYRLNELIAKIDKIQLEGSAETVREMLSESNSIAKFWGLTSCLADPGKWRSELPVFEKMLDDDSPNVQIAAAELALRLKDSPRALETLARQIQKENEMVCVYALNAVDRLGSKVKSLMPRIERIDESFGKYSLRMATYLIDKQSAEAE